MNISLLRRLAPVFILLSSTIPLTHAAQAAALAAADDASSAASTASAASDWQSPNGSHGHHGRHDKQIVSIGHSSNLAKGEQADAVVSILGSSTSEGDTVNVVSILGNTRVTGPVAKDAVAVMGSTYVDSKVDGDVVAVLGNVELGPHADIGGEVVSVLGKVTRDPAAIVHGGVQNVQTGNFGDFAGLHSWVEHCLLYGRPLAFAAGLGWAWTLALGFLAFYVIIALVFRSSLGRCVQTLDTEPGMAVLAAVITMLLTPVFFVLLCITVIGIVALPFVMFSLFCAGLFGKAVALAWIGQRVVGNRPGMIAQPAVAVLIGGAIVLLLYVVPVLGFLAYNLLAIFGLGAVVYTLILGARARQAAKVGQTDFQASPPAAPATPAGSAAREMGGTSTAGDASAEGAGPATTAGPANVAGLANATAPGSSTAKGAASSAAGGAAPLVSAALPRAGFWIRMAALLIDFLLIGFALSVLHPLHHVHLLVLAAYGAVMWKLRGSTVGGIVFDLRVVRLDGRDVDWETAIVRALACFLSLAVVGLGFIWIAFDDAKQGWHDKIARTVVVRVPRGT